MITSYRCATCGHETKTDEEIQKHFDDAHSKHCKICDYKTRDPMAFERHMEFTHDKLQIFSCKLCNEKFVGNNDFDKHLEFTHGTNHWTLNLGSKEARRTLKKMRAGDRIFLSWLVIVIVGILVLTNSEFIRFL